MKSLEQIKECRRLNITNNSFDGGLGVITMSTWIGTVVWSFGGGWEHVSVTPIKKRITPSWDDMCILKDIFFNEDETVVQYHPAKSEYVNNVPNCLHLWRPINDVMPTPPSIMVGLKKGQSIESAIEEIKEYEKMQEKKECAE